MYLEVVCSNRCIFHQHFMRTFFVQKQIAQLSLATFHLCNFLAPKFHKKNARIKRWWRQETNKEKYHLLAFAYREKILVENFGRKFWSKILVENYVFEQEKLSEQNKNIFNFDWTWNRSYWFWNIITGSTKRTGNCRLRMRTPIFLVFNRPLVLWKKYFVFF